MIQIFGRNKCFDTKKAIMYFKERRIPYSFIDLKEKSLSLKEIDSIYNAIENINLLIDKKSKLYKELYVEHLERTVEQYKFLLIENSDLIVTPIIRFKNKALVGFDKRKIEEFLKSIVNIN